MTLILTGIKHRLEYQQRLDRVKQVCKKYTDSKGLAVFLFDSTYIQKLTENYQLRTDQAV